MKSALSLCLPIGLILCGAGAAAFLKYANANTSNKSEDTQIETLDPAATYYVFISELEVHSKSIDGTEEEDWDDDDDAPDLFYTIHFEEKKVYSSAERKDTFVANWRGVTVPLALGELQNVVKGDVNVSIDFEEIISAARLKGDAQFSLQMFDNDTVSRNDRIGEKTLHLKKLQEGTNVFENLNPTESNGWKRIELKVVKREGSVKDYLLPLLREMSQEKTITPASE